MKHRYKFTGQNFKKRGVRMHDGMLIGNMSETVRELLKNIDLTEAQEIRLRKNMPLTIHFVRMYFYVSKNGTLTQKESDSYIVSAYDIERTLELLCSGSVYSFKEQIKSGYITTAYGHRVGIAGRCVTENGKVTYIKDISGLNFRIARQVKDAAKDIINKVIKGDKVKNTLVISSPGGGKTTLLRDIANKASCAGIKTVVVDERSEIAAMLDGICTYDMGPVSDVLDACPKAEGIMLAIRSLSPQLIVCDEIGKESDFEAVCEASRCGVAVVSSIHGKNLEQVQKRYRDIAHYFDVFITLDSKTENRIKEVITNDDTDEQKMRYKYA